MRRWVWIVVPVVALASCDAASPPDSGFHVLATTNILGDIISNVARPEMTVDVLMPVGVDPHDFQPSSAQVAAIARADLVVANGGGLEEGLADVLESARADGVRVIEVLPAVDPLQRDGWRDPHFWLDAVRVKDAAVFIAQELDVAGTDTVTVYLDQLDALHLEIISKLSEIPPGSRKLVTNHDSFAYFAERYDFDVVGVVIPGGSSLGDPSSKDLADLVGYIVTQNVRAIFADSSQPMLLAETIAHEAGRSIAVVELYTGSLGSPGSGADTLIGMLLSNAGLIVEALTP